MPVKYRRHDNMQLDFRPRPARGGVHAWMALFGSWLAIAATFGYTFTFAVYQDVYTRADIASSTGVRWIGTIQLFLLLATSLPAGMLHDSGRSCGIITAGSCVFTLSLFMLSHIDLVDYFTFLYIQGIVMGVAAGLVCVPCLAICTDHWGVRSKLAMGIASSGLFVGGTVFPAMLTRFLHNGVSFAWTVRASAFVVLGMLLVANVCIWRSCPRAPPATGATSTSMKELVTDAEYMCVVIAALFMNWGLYFPFVYLQQLVIDHNMDHTFASYTITILCGAAILGCILFAMALYKCRTFSLFAAPAQPCIIVLLFGLPAKTIAGVVVFAVVFGFFAGAWFSQLSPAILSTLSTSTSTRECGVRLGFAFAVSAIAALAGTPIYDAILGSAAPVNWNRSIHFSSMMLAIGMFFCYVALDLRVRRLGTEDM
ncbi:MFS general substrate transporter [Auriscalpium vulgare]|uniref:MFS general substrate transporter n=1 Tax=Auriscalpium vulgare TaxID=40419 RepID=A0ACB8RRC8_9AGAM|nr:MFS general substrate transporter [Auriscalpium vulgare]